MTNNTLSNTEQEDECKQHKWKQTIYCKNCGEYFEEWQLVIKKEIETKLTPEIQKRTVLDLLVDDLSSVLDGMLKEKRITNGVPPHL